MEVRREREDEEGIYDLNSQKNILSWRSFLTFAILTGQDRREMMIDDEPPF